MPLVDELKRISKTDTKNGKVNIPTEGCFCMWFYKRTDVDLSSSESVQYQIDRLQASEDALTRRIASTLQAPSYADGIILIIVGALGIASSALEGVDKIRETKSNQDKIFAISMTIAALSLVYIAIKFICAWINNFEAVPSRNEIVAANAWLTKYSNKTFNVADANELAIKAGKALADTIVVTFRDSSSLRASSSVAAGAGAVTAAAGELNDNVKHTINVVIDKASASLKLNTKLPPGFNLDLSTFHLP